jgi:hypothetical protein
MSGARGAKRTRATAAEKGKGKAAGNASADAAAAAAPPSRDDVRALVARLDRGALEALLVDAVADAAAPTLAALTAALPARLRTAVVTRTRVGDTSTLVTTGPFAALSADETLAIFAFLPLKDKLTVLTEVCPGWRRLRTAPEAWASLHVRADAKWISPPGLARLLAWAPTACGATDVRLDASTGGFSVDAVCRFVKALTRVDTLALKEKVNAKCLDAIRTQHGARLRLLSLEAPAKDQKMLNALLDLLGSCPALHTLSMSSSTLGDTFLTGAPPGEASLTCGLPPNALRFVSEHAAETRHGGGSLLQKLRAPVNVAGLAVLGSIYPELSTLDLPALLVPAAAGQGRISNWAPKSAADEAEGDAAIVAALPSGADVTPLPRLARLSVSFAGEAFGAPSPGSVAHVLAALLPALPPAHLRSLAVRANVNTPSTVACPLAHLQPGAAARLHSLLLQGFHLGDTDAMDDDEDADGDGALAALRELRSLSLDNCTGSRAAREACGAVARCASLRTLRLANMRLDAAACAALPPSGQLACLTLERSGASAPAALLAAARAGALASLVTLALLSPAAEPLKKDAARSDMAAAVVHDTALAGVFAPDAPLPTLRTLTLRGADMCATAEWPRLVAPALRTITLVMGDSTRSLQRGALRHGASEWEAVRAAVAAAVAKACPHAEVVLTEEPERSFREMLSNEGNACDAF